MSGSLKMRPCLPKTIPRTNLRSYSVSALKSFAVILRPRKSKLSQVLMLAYSSCAKTDEDALSSANRKSIARKRQDVTGDFIFTFRLERRPKEPYFAGPTSVEMQNRTGRQPYPKISRTLSDSFLSSRSFVSTRSSCSSNLRCSRVSIVGVTTETDTNKSPRPRPPSTGMPCPRTHKTEPVFVPPGTLGLFLLLSVLTL